MSGGEEEESAAAAAAAAHVTLSDLRRMMADFARDRDWERFHSPRNLLLALVGEVGELSEIFQWRGEVERGLPDWPPQDKEHVGEELSDVLLYLIRLADVCGVDLAHAVLSKLRKNAAKYPAHLCRASSRKYTAYQNQVGDDAVGNAAAAAAPDPSSHRDEHPPSQQPQQQQR